jgi:hypothetical protein
MQNNVQPCSIRRTTGAAIAVNLVVMIDSSNLAQIHDGTLTKPYLAYEGVGSGEQITLLEIGDDPIRVVSAGAHTLGAAVYLDIATGKATATASKLRLGFAREDKSSGAGTILIAPDVQFAPVGTLALLAQTTAGTYTQAQVQAIADKLDALIALVQKSR